MSKTLYNLGCRISAWGATLAGHPFAIFTVAVVCAAWFIIGGTAAENTLTLALSVLAFTLTQMVLNQQRLSERALHMKIDELVFAMKGPGTRSRASSARRRRSWRHYDGPATLPRTFSTAGTGNRRRPAWLLEATRVLER